MKTKVIILILFSTVCLSGFSQKSNKKFTVTGTVLDASGLPVTNAIVMIDGHETNSLTDINGKYRIRVSPNAETIGIFTFGNGVMGELIDGRTTIDFKFGTPVLSPDRFLGPGEEAVNTGYTSVRKKDLTTEIDKIDGTDKKFKSYSSIYEMIQRECAGVIVNGSSVIIQDSKNIQGSVPPLFVVDGIYVDNISHITPSVVESIEVLKGTAAAIYGSRGYGGAIVIRTKVKID